MIDTVRLQAQLTKRQWEKLYDLVMSKEREHWGLFRPQEGTIWIRYLKDLVTSNHPSYERDIFWSISDHYTDEKTFLTVELSIPKYQYGHNVHLLYGWLEVLQEFRKSIQKQLQLTRSPLPPIEDWLVRRCDFCYAWRLPNQDTAVALINAMKRLRYPWKKPRIYPTSVVWPGRTYSVKIYAKHPEFRANDLKRMLKAGASHEFVNEVECKALGVIRFEITGRNQWLKTIGIETVSDLTGKAINWAISPDLMKWMKSLDDVVENLIPVVLKIVEAEGHCDCKKLDSGEPITFPDLISPPLPPENKTYRIPGGTIIPVVMNRPMFLIHKYLSKLVGTGDMSIKDKVMEKLRESYSDNKAARLMGFWLQIQTFGCDEVREIYTQPTYYRNMSDLKKAGVTILESTNNLVKVDPNFFNTFKLAAPSDRVTNQFDDFRGSDNLLNLSAYKQQGHG